jgi:hypothetical protein
MSLATALAEALPPICDVRQISKALGRTPAAIYRDVRLGRLVPPTKLGDGPKAAARWSRDDVIAAYGGN